MGLCYSRLIRTAAAAASGASVSASTASAASNSRGAMSGPPLIATCVARAPKISTGSDSGSVSSDSSALLRLMFSVNAAPIEPMRLSVMLPNSYGRDDAAERRRGRTERERRKGRHAGERQPGQQPVREGLGTQECGQ